MTALQLRSQLVIGRPVGGQAGESAPPLTRLTDALAGKELLLILDNCEHLIGAAAEVADAVLRSAPGLWLLATSREPLGIPGEQLWPVEPLALPPTEAQAASYPAVRLLLDRAVAARPGFVLDPRTTGPVVGICRALDGMPLAIELPPACARCRSTCWRAAWPTGSGCSPTAAAPHCPGTRRCGRSWTGAGICSMTPSGRCGGGSPSSTAVPT
jgi:hypothetical protein